VTTVSTSLTLADTVPAMAEHLERSRAEFDAARLAVVEAARLSDSALRR
jgi:hypothetical protein